MDRTTFEVEARKLKIFPKFYKKWKSYFAIVLLLQLFWIVLMAVSLKYPERTTFSFRKMDKYQEAHYQKDLKQNEPLIFVLCALMSIGQIFGWIGFSKPNLLLLSIFNRISVTTTVAIACKIIIHYENPVNYMELIIMIPFLIVTRKFITKVKIIEVFYASKM